MKAIAKGLVTAVAAMALVAACDDRAQTAVPYGGLGAKVERGHGVADTHGMPEWAVEAQGRNGALAGGFGTYEQLGGLGLRTFQHNQWVPRPVGLETNVATEARGGGPEYPQRQPLALPSFTPGDAERVMSHHPRR